MKTAALVPLLVYATVPTARVPNPTENAYKIFPKSRGEIPPEGHSSSSGSASIIDNDAKPLIPAVSAEER